jgi:hypothetical protein
MNYQDLRAINGSLVRILRGFLAYILRQIRAPDGHVACESSRLGACWADGSDDSAGSD